jgi:hypothetical protein
MTTGMRMSLTGTILAIGVGLAGDVLACGDKFFVAGRGTLFHRTPADRTAAGVLFFAPPESELARTLARLNVEAAMQKAGYRPTVVTSLGDLDRVAPGRPWDVILTDLADGYALERRAGRTMQPVVLPVAHQASGAQLAQARTAFALVLKSPSRNQDFLDAIDEAVAVSRASRTSRQPWRPRGPSRSPGRPGCRRRAPAPSARPSRPSNTRATG